MQQPTAAAATPRSAWSVALVVNDQPGSVANSFEAFVVANAGFFADLAYLVTGDRKKSRAITAKAWMPIFRSWPRLERSRQPRAAATAVVIDTFLRHARATKPAGGGGLQLQEHHNLRLGTVLGFGSDEDPLWEAIEDLAPRQRAVVVLRCFGGFSGPEIGRALRWRTPRPTATAVKALRELMLTVAPQQPGDRQEANPLASFERRVRACLRQRADADVDPQEVVLSLRERFTSVPQKSRHSPAPLVAAALLVTAVVTAGVHLAAGDSPDREPAAEAPRPLVAPVGTRLVGYGQLAVAVPAAWGHNLTECGTGGGDTVLYPDAARLSSCLVRGESSSVSFSDPLTSVIPLGRAPHEVDEIAGHLVFEVDLREPYGVKQRMVIVPEADFQMVVRSDQESVIDNIVASLREVPQGYAVVPVCERLLLGDASERLDDAGLRVQLTQASYVSQRYGQPPVTHQSIAPGTLVPTGTTIGIGFPSMD